MKLIIALLISFSSFANNDTITETKSIFPIESVDNYPGGKKKKNRKGKRANKKRSKMCRKMHKNRR